MTLANTFAAASLRIPVLLRIAGRSSIIAAAALGEPILGRAA
jgi:hypothetical protein